MKDYLNNNKIIKNMKKNIFKIGLITTFILVPLFTFAAGKTLKDIAGQVTDYLTIAIYLVISLAVLTFIWNVYRYFFTEKEKKDAGMYVLYSTIGFFVMLSLWGLVTILSNTLDLPKDAPRWPFGGNSPINSINNNQLNPGNTIPDTTTR